MSLRKRTKYDYPSVTTNYNETSPNNPSNAVDENTNFVLRPITYENIDQAVYEEFNKRFTISNKQLGVILLDAEIASMQYDNFEQFDKTKGYLNLPFFTMWRNNIAPLFRSSPSHKPSTYIIPKKKAQGIVYEEYIMPVPKWEKLSYVFKFLSNYRENVNVFENQMNNYFKNKRNIINLDNERFQIMPTDQDTRGTLEVIDREGSSGQSLYVLTYEITVWAYTRRLEDVQKRERKNTFDIKITERDGRGSTDITQTATRLPEKSQE